MMMPPEIYKGCPSPGEREIFRRLKDDRDTNGWTVLHSLDIVKHVKKVSGEADFVVIIPSKGVLCVEVKACSRLERDEKGAWYYGSASEPDMRGPFKQASEAMHSLRNIVTSRRSDLSRVVFWSAVIFPYVPFNTSSSEWHPWQVIDTRAFKSKPLSQLLEGVLDSARMFLGSRESAKWFSPESEEPYPEQCRKIAEILRPSFEYFESHDSLSKRRSEELKHYTEEQFAALDAMATNKRVAFVGPAGTGKTFLAIEATRRSVGEGKPTLFLCFNRFLAGWLTEQTRAIGPLARVDTIHHHMLEVAGLDPVDIDTGEEFWTEELPYKALEEILRREGEGSTYEALVIDEAQDIMRESYLDFLDLSLAGGLAAGNWRVFGDFEKQEIYGKENVTLEEFLRSRLSGAPVYSLRTNCRNTPRVAALVHILGGLEPDYNKVLRPDDGVEPEIIEYGEGQEQAVLTDLLERLLEEGFVPDDIAVLSTRPGDKCLAALCKDQKLGGKLAPFGGTSKGQIAFCSIYSFKGLEAPAVVITDIDSIEGIHSNNVFYVGITRSIQRLAILLSSPVRQKIISKLTTRD